MDHLSCASRRDTTIYRGIGWLVVPTLSIALSVSSACAVEGQQGVEAYGFLLGSWSGVLEYLDYGDDRTVVRLPTRLECVPGPDGASIELRFSYEEPDGSVVASTERLTETADGVYLGDLWEVEQPAGRVSADGYLLVLRRDGEDNGRPASVQNRVSVRGDLLTITTTVTYEGASESIQRHEYRLRRAS